MPFLQLIDLLGAFRLQYQRRSLQHFAEPHLYSVEVQHHEVLKEHLLLFFQPLLLQLSNDF
jgi:hypothetical protein